MSEVTTIIDEYEIVIQDDGSQIYVIEQDQQPQIVTIAAEGPQGAPGPNSIGGYGFAIDNVIDGDVLGFNGAAWYNRHQETLTDGGNF